MEDLIFLETFQSKVKAIGLKIEEELPQYRESISVKPGKLTTIKYSKLEDWDVRGMISGRSRPLERLCNKINHMIRKGNAEGIKRMLDKIATGRIKSLSKPRYPNSIYLGRGHFRWDDSAVTLTNEELERIRVYFKYN